VRSFRSFIVFGTLLSVASASVVTLVSEMALAQDPPKAKRAAPARTVKKARERAAKAAARRKATDAPDPGAATPAPAAAGPAVPGAAAVPGANALPAPAARPEKEPPGAAPALPTTMDKIAQATDVPFQAKPGGHRVKFNLQDADLAELVNHISGLTGRRFIYGAKVRQIKATVVCPEPVTLDEAYEAFLSILEANGMTVVPHGRFLKIVDSGGVVTQPTPLYARGEPVPYADRYITRLYRLANVTPAEIVPILSKFKSKDGDITPYDPGQLIIITDTATQVQRLIRIVEEVDIGGAGQRMWIEPVRHGSATEMAKRLNELFEIGGAPGQPGQPGAAAKASGLQRVIADDGSNSLIVVGTEDSYLRMLELLKRLDTTGTDTGRVHVLPLQHSIAEELAATLTQMLQGQTQKAGQAAQPGNAAGMFEGDLRVTADKSTNSLLITSSGRDYATLRLVVDKLDRPRRQVFIEAVIMDLAVSDGIDFGMAFHGGHSFGGGEDDPFMLSGFNAGQSLAFPTDPNLLQGFAAGIRGSELSGTEGLLGPGISIPAFGVVLSALATSGKSNVLATPHIIATDNVSAEINIGENIPLQTNIGGSNLSSLAGLAGGAGGGNTAGLGSLLGLGLGSGFNAPRQDVGNKIKVTPHINESNQVRLEIEQESSAPGAAVGQLGAVPITKRTANTTVVVADQQTVVIGGLMRDEYVTTREKIPVLGDLPVLGALFRHSNTTKRKANLLLVLTPHVIRDQTDLRRIFERKMQERQEFLDRYFVFADSEWTPPKDWSRTNGLVEDIRQSYLEIDEQLRLERESLAPEDEERVPSDPIDLPDEVRAGGGTKTTTKATKTTTTAPKPTKAPRKAPARTRKRSELESPIIINPVARSVNVEELE
jgi:general secretion pathway protein D